MGPGHKPPPPLVAAARARIKAVDPLSDRPFDRGVVADLEMKTIHLLLAAPVATPEVMIITHAHRHGDGLAGIPRWAENSTTCSRWPSQQFKKAASRYLLPQAPNGRKLLVEPMHGLHQFQIQLIPVSAVTVNPALATALRSRLMLRRWFALKL